MNGNEGLESDVGQDYSYRVCVQAQGQLVYMHCLIFILTAESLVLSSPFFEGGNVEMPCGQDAVKAFRG